MPLRETLNPFSHVLGENCMIPLTSWNVKAYPTRLELKDFESERSISIILYVNGPAAHFTLMQDLRRCFVRVFFQSQEGHFSLRFSFQDGALKLLLERSPEEGLELSIDGKKERLKRKESHDLCIVPPLNPSFERVHLGSHKKQDWTLVKRRLGLEEILPIWFALGQNVPSGEVHYEGTAKLLMALEKLIEKQDREHASPLFLQLFQIGFSGILTPRLVDTDYQGIISDENPKGSPLVLLSEGAKLIRKLFIKAEDHLLAILPCLPVELHAGRLFDIQVSKTLALDLEWSKKTIRTLSLKSSEDQNYQLRLQKGVQSFRMRTSKHEKGTRFSRDEMLKLQAGKYYLLDRFEK